MNSLTIPYRYFNWFYFLCLGWLLISCKKYDLDNFCNVDDPLIELEWLEKKVENKPDWGVYASILNETPGMKRTEGIILIKEGIRRYYDCEGHLICHSGVIYGVICENYEVVIERPLK